VIPWREILFRNKELEDDLRITRQLHHDTADQRDAALAEVERLTACREVLSEMLDTAALVFPAYWEDRMRAALDASGRDGGGA